MFFHVIENTKRDGVECYRKVKTYRTYRNLEKYLRRTGKPCWIIESRTADYLDRATHLGGVSASYWNSGGFGYTGMPVFPFWPGK